MEDDQASISCDQESSESVDQDPIYNALRAGYLFALQMPHNVVRIRGQGTLAQMRSAIAAYEGRSDEEVQNEFEELALKARMETGCEL